jgi:hypothetical protein
MIREDIHRPTRISPEQVRACKKYRDCSDAEVDEVINSLEQLAIIVIKYCTSKSNPYEEPKSPSAIQQRQAS